MPAALVAAAACSPAAPAAPAPGAAQCVVADDSARAHITFGIGTDARRDPGYSAVEILVGQLYETLVRTDCAGRVIAGLADSWSSTDGTHWQFALRRDASFTDGTRADARNVAAVLSRVPMLAAVAAMGEYDLRVTLHAPADVRLFARRELMVVRMEGPGLPSGTGPYSALPQRGARMVQLVVRGDSSAVQRTRTRSDAAPDTISVRDFGADLRRAIDAGVDALVTSDVATIAYAQARSGYSVAPLTWSSTHVLATVQSSDSVAEVPSTAFPTALVGAASRPALPPFWWNDCASPAGGESLAERDAAADRAAPGGHDGRILFLRSDPVARAIAERITALARGRAPAWLADRLSHDRAPTAAGVERAELLDAVRERSALAVVTPLRRVEHGDCDVANPELYARLIAGWRITPLIDTRNDLIYSPGIGRVTVDADGTIRFGER